MNIKYIHNNKLIFVIFLILIIALGFSLIVIKDFTHLFFPDAKREKQKRCFNNHEWSFFTDFFKLNDFAGINLYIDLLPKKCLNEFYQRLGNPVMVTTIPKIVKVQFIPKSSEFREQVNSKLGASLKFN